MMGDSPYFMRNSSKMKLQVLLVKVIFMSIVKMGLLFVFWVFHLNIIPRIPIIPQLWFYSAENKSILVCYCFRCVCVCVCVCVYITENPKWIRIAEGFSLPLLDAIFLFSLFLIDAWTASFKILSIGTCLISELPNQESDEWLAVVTQGNMFELNWLHNCTTFSFATAGR